MSIQWPLAASLNERLAAKTVHGRHGNNSCTAKGGESQIAYYQFLMIIASSATHEGQRIYKGRKTWIRTEPSCHTHVLTQTRTSKPAKPHF